MSICYIDSAMQHISSMLNVSWQTGESGTKNKFSSTTSTKTKKFLDYISTWTSF